MDNWEYNVLGIYNYTRPGKLDEYFKSIRANLSLEGDICEVGVFRGSSLLSTCLLLKELGSDKKVIGFDSFSGLPRKSDEDKPEVFDAMHYEGVISDSHYDDIVKLRKYRKGRSLSTNGDFSQCSANRIRNKANLLGLDNFKLIAGPFRKTLTGRYTFMAALMDCDLYQSYKIALPFVWERMTKKGYVFLDEYYSLKFPGARLACDEFDFRPKRHKRIKGEFERWYAVK
jgi:Macrocin-O-methyltransferase (TylF)